MKTRDIYRVLPIVVVMLAWFAPSAHARWYDPGTGRWLERDPLGARPMSNRPASTRVGQVDRNLYGYVRSKPIHRVDPWGLQDESPGDSNPADASTAAGEQPDIPKCKINSEDMGPLQFDGRKFTFGNCKCDAVSGRPDPSEVTMEDEDGTPRFGGIWHYDKQRQRMRNQGPIPEGKYWISTCETRDAQTPPSIHDPWWGIIPINLIDHPAWGDFSWPIHIFPGTDTLDDDPKNPRPRGLPGERFYIHGGATWGSAGCIDLKNHDGTFKNFIDQVAKQNSGCCYIPLDVAYSLQTKGFPQFIPEDPGKCDCK